MSCVAGEGLILHGESWFAGLNTLLLSSQSHRYSQSVPTRNLANMENNELAVQDISNHHENDACKWLSCPCFPDQQEIDSP
jgi:hypothetical protein